MLSLKDLTNKFKSVDFSDKEKVQDLIYKAGMFLVALGFLAAFFIYGKVFLVYIFYYIDKPEENIEVRLPDSNEKLEDDENPAGDIESVEFVDNEFGIIIPKIGTNAKIVKDVDPFNRKTYTEALKEGVAHAKGTSYPGALGNTFVFAHSAVAFYEATNQNVQFYLLSELEREDEFFVVYENKIYTYEVEEVLKVDPSEVEYLTQYREYNTFTLMTCWPAGMNYKRIIVIAREKIS